MNSVLVTGLARDVGKHIIREVERINKQMKKTFSEINFLIIESDSQDDTLDKLKTLQDKYINFEYISLNKLEPLYPDRIKRLTLCRNQYVHQIRSNPKYKSTEFVSVIDFDIRNNRLNLKVLNDWISRGNWYGLFANQTGFYYDIYALRSVNWCENDCFDEYRELSKYLPAKDAKNKAIWSKMKKISKHSKPIEVKSAFGGLALYNKEIFLKYDYTNLDDSVNQSEHVVLHEKVEGNVGKMWIVPSLTNFSWNPHNLSKFRVIRILDNFTQKQIFKKIRVFIRYLLF